MLASGGYGTAIVLSPGCTAVLLGRASLYISMEPSPATWGPSVSRIAILVPDGDGWKQVWAAMTDAELEDRLFTYRWLSLHTPNAHASRVARLIQEAERRDKIHAGT